MRSESGSQPCELRVLVNCKGLFSTSAAPEAEPVARNRESDGGLLAASDEEVLLDSDIRCEVENARDLGDDFLLAADDEGDTRRPYAQRRGEPVKFLGKDVRVYALQCLLGLGTSTVHWLRSGEQVFRRLKTPSTQRLGSQWPRLRARSRLGSSCFCGRPIRAQVK